LDADADDDVLQMVLFNAGPNRSDATCGGRLSLPHVLVSSNSSKSERIMASGNERSVARFNLPSSSPSEMVGYHLNEEDKFHLIIDLMNETKGTKLVYVTMTYDYVDGHAAGFSKIKPVWLDVVACGTSERELPQEHGTFDISHS
jgi:hypothetical protein